LLLLIGGVGVVSAEAEEPSIFYAEDIKAAMQVHLDRTLDEEGVFHLVDDVTGEALKLTFMQVHDHVRQMDGDSNVARTEFHAIGEEDRVYDIDFWLRPVNGELTVFRTKVHKEPRQSLFGWYKHPRYTFVGDDIEYLYESD